MVEAQVKHAEQCGWVFGGGTGEFAWDSPLWANRLYFPLCSTRGLLSSITPQLHGDIKTGQESFLTPPVTVEDLHNCRSARNFWVYIYGRGPWSATGNSAAQRARRSLAAPEPGLRVEAGLLWHRVIRTDPGEGLESEAFSFVPHDENVEVMRLTVRNRGCEILRCTPTSAVPLFCRSADNIRDHRHVTGLVNRYSAVTGGFVIRPGIVFDERGHRASGLRYYCLGLDDAGNTPVGSFPVVDDFIGSGDFEWPEAVVRNRAPAEESAAVPDGREYVGALRFADVYLKPGESRTWTVFLGIAEDEATVAGILARYGTEEKLDAAVRAASACWRELTGCPEFIFPDQRRTGWLRWVSLQPVLRTMFGNSFLPYHDYGKGGRGWRDLWQDLLAVLLRDPAQVRPRLLDNFAGVRIDGTNATITGHGSGQFLADRNNIPRVWMDHGAWPWLTVRLYLEQTGDHAFLLEKQVYFRDAFLERATGIDGNWSPSSGTVLQTSSGAAYAGTVLEHLLVQHLVSIHNTGEHGLVRLEDADWNDAIDMAAERGESVPFSALYAGNLVEIAALLRSERGFGGVELAEELMELLEPAGTSPLTAYFARVRHGVSGRTVRIAHDVLAERLERLGRAMLDHIRATQWIGVDAETGFFNSYYDNDGQRVDGVFADGVVMEMIGQVFCIMAGAADHAQIRMICNACRSYLRDPQHGGFRLNTRYRDIGTAFGRVTAFSYGEKENGATFSHMVVMLAYALCRHGFVAEGHEVLESLYGLAVKSGVAGIYPGLPEYFTPEGRGMYPYLTGSASWLILTLVQGFCGIRGEGGGFSITPALPAALFAGGPAISVRLRMAGYPLEVTYLNPGRVEQGEYRILACEVNGKLLDIPGGAMVYMDSGQLREYLVAGELNRICIRLGRQA